MIKKILILGKGFIGQSLINEFPSAIDGSRIKTYSDAKRVIEDYRPRIIINCIGSTGDRNVDDCEKDKQKTLFANSFIPVMLAELALRGNIKLIHISTGCIFNFDSGKDRPIKETSQNYFLKLFYSRSKIYADRALEALAGSHNILILRIRIPLSNRRHPKNLLDKLIKYKKIIDIPNSVTYLPDFVSALKHLIKTDARGIYNVVNKGGLRYPKLLDIYQKYVPQFRYRVVEFKKLKLARTNLLLSTRKLKDSGFNIRNINSVLEECVKGYLKS